VRCLLIALVLLATAAGQDDIQQARKLISEGKLELALALYEGVLDKTPASYDANLGAGVVLDLNGQYSKARKYLSKAIAVAPAQSKAQALTAIAISYAFTRDCKDSSKYEREVYDLWVLAQDWTAAAEVANEAGRICLESGSVEEAEQWYRNGHETALKRPDLSAAETDLWTLRWESAEARIAARRGKHDEAAQQHVAALKAILDKGSNPTQAPFYPYVAGYVAFYAGDYKSAAAELEKADQRDPFILSLLAQSWEKDGKKTKAMDLYRKIMTINIHNLTNALARPLARRKLGRSV
jgi:tetratricopeptide (TPR) repeat protein